MRIREIRQLLDARLLCGEALLDEEIHTACGSDLMSDVLAFGDGKMLITGLVNPQVIRTAEMMDIRCIVFGRDKTPDANMIEMARERDIVLMASRKSMFDICGRLYAAGLRGGE